MRLQRVNLCVALVLACPQVMAADFQHSLAQEPYTGLLKTPNAQVADYGLAQFDFSNPIERQGGYIDGYNYMATAGLFPGLEVTGRIATQEHDSHCFTEGCGIRDLSASAKYQLPFIPKEWFDVAIGARDMGGAANNFRAYYGVLSKEWKQLRFTAGAGTSESPLGQLDGPFGGVEWQPFGWLQLLAEYDANSVNLGAKLFTPQQWSPTGWQAYTSVQAYQQEDRAERDYWFGVGIKVPMWLGSKHTAAAVQSNRITPEEIADANQRVASVSQQATTTSSVTAVSVPATVTPAVTKPEIADTQPLVAQLQQAGFESIRAAVIDNQLMVALENNRYNWNELDALGVALGLMADYAPAQTRDLQLILLNQKLPVLAVSSSKTCAQAYLQQTGNCDNRTTFFDVSTRDLTKQLAKLNTQPETNNASFRPRLVVAPAIRSNVATEYGVLDYSLALSSNLQLPLWQGAMFDTRHLAPLSESDDYEDGAIWGKSRYESEFDRVLVHQAFRLPAELFTKFSAGRIMSDYEGVQNETRWESAQGVHRFKLETARFTSDERDHTATPILGSYRYYKADWDWAGELTVGEFWQGDHGYKLVSKHWFGDTEIRLFLRDTREQIAGIEFAIPLTLRQDMKPTRFGQLRGSEQFAYGIETLVGKEHNRLTSGIGITPGLTHNVDQVYFNRDRLSPAYVESHLIRLREAYQQYVVAEK